MTAGPILVAVDEQPQTELAVSAGRRIAGALELPLGLVTVYEVEPWLLDVDAGEQVERARRWAEDVLARVAIDGAERRAVGAPSVPHGLQNAVDEQGAALLVLGGSHREGVGRRLVPGGTAERLLTGASCPLLVAAGPLAVAGAVVVAYDATPEADAALDWAAPLAARLGSPLALWHVTAPTVPRRTSDPELYREFTSYIHGVAERMLAKGVERLPTGAAASTAVMEGEVGETLAHRAAAEPAALVVCGSRGYGPARTVLMGSTARSLLSHATCPVAVVPRG